MSDSPAPEGPDFLDRLIARHTAPGPTAVRVRPRLPGPFERIEAVRAATPGPDEDTLLWPSATPSAAPPAQAPRPATGPTRTHTERERTVVREERAPEQPASRPSEQAARTEVPLLRPAAPVAPGPRPLPDVVRRAPGRGREEPSRTAVAGTAQRGTDTAPVVVAPAPRPDAADTTAARDAVRQAAARRPGRAAEQVVQVQIGRLEVTAASGAPGDGSRRSAGSRPGATVSLADYLARGRE
ncbi:hypothetical protein [Streptomyces sp. NPDC050759]|uniref:hypothetical protein n=1 Tax=Streptomyces sp. NPDC050759 TaxID=3365635 RepID=UPI00379B2929